MLESRDIIFYDGACVICNASVQFLIKRDIPNLYFTSNTSSFALDFFKTNGMRDIDMDTIYYYSRGQIYTRSTAILEVAKSISRWYRILASALQLIPKSISDILYDFIARNRKRLGSYQGCMVLSQEQRSKIIS